MRYSKMNSWLQSSFVLYVILISAVLADRFQIFSILPTQIQRLDFGNPFFTATSPTNCEQERTNCINKCTEEKMLFRCSSFTGLASTCTCTSPPSISSPSLKNETLRCKSSRWQCEQTCGPNPNFQCSDQGSTISQSCSCTHELSENSNSNAFAHSEAVSKPTLINENIIKSKNNSTSGTFSSGEAISSVNSTVVGTVGVQISSIGTNTSEVINVDLPQQEDNVIDVIDGTDINNSNTTNITVSNSDKNNEEDIEASSGSDSVIKYENSDDSIAVARSTAIVQSSNKTEEITEATTINKSVQKNKQQVDDDDQEGDDDDSDDDEQEDEEEEEGEGDDDEEEGEGDNDDEDEEGDDEEEEGDDDDEDEEGDDDDEDEDEEGDDDDDDEDEENTKQSSTKNSTLSAECKKAKANCQTKCKNMEIDFDCQSNGGAFTQSCACVSKNEKLSPSPSTSKPKSPTPTPTPIPTPESSAKSPIPTPTPTPTPESSSEPPTPIPTPATEAVSTGRSSLTPKIINQTSANVIVSASVVPSITDIDALNTTVEVTDMHAQNITLETPQIVLSNIEPPIQEPTFLIDVLSFTDQQSLECQLAAENCRLMCGDMMPKFECGQILNVISQNCSCSSANVLSKSDTTQSTTYSTLNSHALNVTNSTKNVQNVQNAAGVASKSTATAQISTANSGENVQNADNVTSKSTTTGTISTTNSSENVQNAGNITSNGTTQTAIRTIDTTVEAADEPLNEYSVNNIFSGKNQVNNNLLNSNNTVVKSSLSKKVAMEPECEQAKKECEKTCGEMEIQFDCQKVGINFAKSCACVSKNVNVSNIDAFSGAQADLSESMKTRMQEILKMQNEP